ncbi:Rad24 protein [Hanseniaspora uvarum]|nr:Rad24 protein [Hanseniaspora uvarum]
MSYEKSRLPLYMKYAPNTLDELFLHPKKIKDMRNILTNELFDSNHDLNMLIVSGPTGSCKTSLIKLLINEYYDNNKFLYQTFDIQNVQKNDHFIEFDPLDKSINFEMFLNNCKLFKKNSKMMKVVLIKYLPNIYFDQMHSQFLKAIKDYLNNDYYNEFPPLIFVISECDIPKDDTNDVSDDLYTRFDIHSHYITETIFDKEILQNYRVKKITVNPVAKTYLKKILKRVIEKEIIQMNTSNTLNRKIKISAFSGIIDELSNLKDVPSALSQLESYLQAFENKIDFKSLKIDNRDTGISLFHAVGKIFFGTKEEGYTNDDIIKLLNKDYQQYIDPVFKYTIFENFKVAEIKGLNNFTNMVDVMSETDIMNSSLGTEAYIRKIRFLCSDLKEDLQKAEVKANSIKFTPNFKILRKQREVKYQIKDLQLLKIAKNNEFVDINDLLLYGNELESKLLTHYYREYQAWKEYRINVGKLTDGYAKPGRLIDPKIDYMDIIGGKFGTINSIADMDINTDIGIYSNSKYREFLKQTKNDKTNMDVKKEVDIPYDENLDDFDIESSSDESMSGSSSDEELFLLASQQIEKEKNFMSLSRTPSPLKKSIPISEDSNDSDEELFQLTSQHLNKIQKK